MRIQSVIALVTVTAAGLVVVVRGIGTAGAVKRNAVNALRHVDNPDFSGCERAHERVLKIHSGGEKKPG